MAVPRALHTYLAPIHVTYNSNDWSNLPQVVDAELSRRQGITAIAYANTCVDGKQVVDTVGVDFGALSEKEAYEIFYQTKEISLAVRKFVGGGLPKENFSWSRPIGLVDLLQKQLQKEAKNPPSLTEREFADFTKQEWATRFHLILLQLPQWENAEKREVMIGFSSMINPRKPGVGFAEGEELLARGKEPDFYWRLGEERMGVHREFFERALQTREGGRVNAFTKHFEQELPAAEIDLSGSLLSSEDVKLVLPLLRDYFYKGELKCDSDLVPSLFVLADHLGLEVLQRSLRPFMFGMEQIRKRIEKEIGVMEQLVKQPTTSLQKIVEAALPVKKLLSAFDQEKFMSDRHWVW